jgi:hypothetical protein
MGPMPSGGRGGWSSEPQSERQNVGTCAVGSRDDRARNEPAAVLDRSQNGVVQDTDQRVSGRDRRHESSASLRFGPAAGELVGGRPPGRAQAITCLRGSGLVEGRAATVSARASLARHTTNLTEGSHSARIECFYFRSRKFRHHPCVRREAEQVLNTQHTHTDRAFLREHPIHDGGTAAGRGSDDAPALPRA